MERSLRPELLDSLPPAHPDALHNRRDLRLTNAVMGNHRWIVGEVVKLFRTGLRVLEVGAGTGELGERLARCGIVADGLDVWPRPVGWPAGAKWHQADLTSFEGWTDYDVVIGNLIFHQFDDATLRALGHSFRHLSGFVACEPVRRWSSQKLFATVAPLLGANHVSLHDAHVSIAAGFLGDELPRLLGFNAPDWKTRSHATWLGAYRSVARRSA